MHTSECLFLRGAIAVPFVQLEHPRVELPAALIAAWLVTSLWSRCVIDRPTRTLHHGILPTIRASIRCLPIWQTRSHQVPFRKHRWPWINATVRIWIGSCTFVLDGVSDFLITVAEAFRAAILVLIGTVSSFLAELRESSILCQHI